MTMVMTWQDSNARKGMAWGRLVQRTLRRMQAWTRLYRRRAALVRTLGMLDARDRADIGLPTSPSLDGLERMARMFMMR